MSPTYDASFSAEPWYRIDLTSEDWEGGAAEVIEGAFRQIYIACNAPPGMAMLSAPSERDGGYSVYFTPHSLPHARALVIAYDAVRDAMPAERRLTLRVGDPALALGTARAF